MIMSFCRFDVADRSRRTHSVHRIHWTQDRQIAEWPRRASDAEFHENVKT